MHYYIYIIYYNQSYTIIKMKSSLFQPQYLFDYKNVIKIVTNPVTFLKTKSRRTLILRVLRFKEVAPPDLCEL
jgi:hypothetical protein